MPPVAEFGLPFAFYAVAALVFGLLVGSFLNVVIYRIPRGESIVYPGSHCGACGAPVRPYDNIPLVSYALLRGQCRLCRAKISLIYPSVELLTGLLFFAVLLKDGLTWITIAEMTFVAVIISLIFIDARHHLLPNVITYPALVLSITANAALAWHGVWAGNQAYFRFSGFTPTSFDTVFFAPSLWGAVLIASAAPVFWIIDRLDEVLFGKYFEWAEADQAEAVVEDPDAEHIAQRRHDRVIYGTMIGGLLLAVGWAVLGYSVSNRMGRGVFDLYGDAYQSAYANLLSACFGAFVGGGLIWLLRALYFYTRGIEGMGLGDVKMMAVIGAFLGWQSAILVLIFGSFLGSIVGLILARRSAKGLKTALPFGVFLGIAALIALFAGTPILQWYTGMFR